MRLTGKTTINASIEERLDAEMQEEIEMQRKNLRKYTNNIRSLLGSERSKEVRKAMISYLVENL